jgi:UDP-glucuronate 4-epimerase
VLHDLRFLVTGAAGFIGSHLSETVVDEGHTVVGVDCFTDYYGKETKLANLSRLRKATRFRLLETDLSSGRLSPLLKDLECAFYLAAQPGVRASWGKELRRQWISTRHRQTDLRS